MAETFRKTKIEKLINNLETSKRVYQESIDNWHSLSHLNLDKEFLKERILKIELLDEILLYIRKDFNLS